jgi:beta-mannanase
MDQGIMLGHQDAMAYGNMWHGESGRSDVKSTCGDYPAVVGWNLSRIESGALANEDSITFKNMIKNIVDINKKGGISVLSWNVENPMDDNHDKYIQGLDRLSDFFLELKDEEGNFIPVIFKPFHNYNDSAFWWGANHCTPEQYKKLWQITVDHFRNDRNIHHILYAYSVYAPRSMDTLTVSYPGDKYVDIIGTDIFLDLDTDVDGNAYKRNLDISLSLITDFSNKYNKIPAITNTGLESIKIATYFTNLVYPVISKYKLSYILFDKNSWNMEEHYFIPIPGHPACENFIDFVNKPEILTMKELYACKKTI